MSQEHRLSTAAALSDLWNGKPIRRVRGGDGATILPGRRLALHLMAQPGVASQLLADHMLREQGLLARLLVAAPASAIGTRLWREPSEDADRAFKGYGARLLAILEHGLPLREGTTAELAPRLLAMSADARATWISFADHVERQLGEDGDLRPIKAFAAKAAEHAARLAGVLALVDDLAAGSLANSYLEAGITLVEHYLCEWLRLAGADDVDEETLLAESLRMWLSTWPEAVVSLPDICQRGPNRIRTRSVAVTAVDALAEAGWLVRVDGGATVAGHHRRDAWRIIEPDGRARA